MSNNSQTKKIITKIFLITEKIQDEFPALYAHLSETPLFLTYEDSDISTINFEQYLESIQQQLKTCIVKIA
jgi:hypothetical protein